MQKKLEIIVASSPADFQNAAVLFREYAEFLARDLSFQNFEKELEEITIQYSFPTGGLLLVQAEGELPVGCVGVKKFEEDICELKRMYIQPKGRGLGFGKKLLKQAFDLAKELGYAKMRLDTLPHLESAVHLYEAEGFYRIEAYTYNPFEGVRYYEKVLK